MPGKCTVSSDEGRQEIAAFLGVDVGAEEKVVARLACAGGINVSRKRALLRGTQRPAGARRSSEVAARAASGDVSVSVIAKSFATSTQSS